MFLHFQSEVRQHLRRAAKNDAVLVTIHHGLIVRGYAGGMSPFATAMRVLYKDTQRIRDAT